MAAFGLWTSQQNSVVTKPNPPPYILQAPESGKLPVQQTCLEVFFASRSFFLFVHKFHLLGHRILVAKKENTILPLMKKLINIHLSGSMMGYELCMSMYSGGQAGRLCSQTG